MIARNTSAKEWSQVLKYIFFLLTYVGFFVTIMALFLMELAAYIPKPAL